MKLKIKTFGDAVKQVKRLYSALGIEYWYVYITDRFISYSENSNVEAYPGDDGKVETALIVNDTIELFILKEDFLFEV